MRQKSVHPESPSERIVKNIRRATRKRHSSEEKIRIVLDGLRGESSIADTLSRARILVLDDNQDSRCDRQARGKPAAYAAHNAPHEPGRVGSSLRTDLSAG